MHIRGGFSFTYVFSRVGNVTFHLFFFQFCLFLSNYVLHREPRSHQEEEATLEAVKLTDKGVESEGEQFHARNLQKKWKREEGAQKG